MRYLRTFIIMALIIALTVPGLVHASLLCRSDPVVVLSNGVTLDIGALISTLPMQVKEVHYELHVPVGVSMIAAIHTPTWLTSQETFTVYADQPRNQYKVTTVVYTTQGNADVVAETLLVSLFGIKLGRYTAAGKEGERLSVTFTAR